MRVPIDAIGPVVMFVIVSIVVPGVWWQVGSAAAGGAILGVLLVAAARRIAHRLADSGKSGSLH